MYGLVNQVYLDTCTANRGMTMSQSMWVPCGTMWDHVGTRSTVFRPVYFKSSFRTNLAQNETPGP